MPRTPAPDDDAALRWDEFDDPSYVESDAAVAAREVGEAGNASAASDADTATTDAALEPAAAA